MDTLLSPTLDYDYQDLGEWSDPRTRQRLKSTRRKRHLRERRRQESRTYSAIFRYPHTDDPIAKSIVDRLQHCRSVDEAAWVLDFELHRWFGHRHNPTRLDGSGDCCCCDISEWLYPMMQRFLKGHE